MNSWFLKSKFCNAAQCQSVSVMIFKIGTTYREKCARAGPSDLSGEKRQARHGLGSTNIRQKKAELTCSGRWQQMGTRQAAGGHELSVQYAAKTDIRSHNIASKPIWVVHGLGDCNSR